MKKKMLISLVACFIAAGSFVHYSLESGHTRDFSLEDIATMAQADGESGTPVDCWHIVPRGGVDLVMACVIEVGGYYYHCKWVTDAIRDEVNGLGTCIP